MTAGRSVRLRTWVLLVAGAVFLAACTSSPSPVPPGSAERGRALFESPKAQCFTCHTVGGGKLVGPDLAGVADRAGERVPNQSAEEYVRTSILDPGAYVVEGFPDAMPRNLGRQLTSAEIDGLVAYLLTLRGGPTVATPASSAPPPAPPQ